MSVLRRVNFLSEQRVDLPDLRSIESSVSADFDTLIQAFVTGTSQGYFIRGFELSMTGAIGGASNNLQVIVDPGAIFHIAASQSGTVFMVPTGTPLQALNSVTNPNVVTGSFSANSTNYVGLDYSRFLDPSTDAEVILWDPTSNTETDIIAPRAQILEYTLSISTTIWPANILPIAIVTTDSGNNVLSITDARWLLFRLGTGGSSPNSFYQYPWTAQTEGRNANPNTSTSNSVNPFEGGDKMLSNLKDWMNAVMTSLAQIQGTPYWFSPSSNSSLSLLREDLGNTIFTGNSTISHGILPNSTPVLNTMGNITVSTNQLTNLASTTGLAIGQLIMGTGIPTATTIINIVGTTVTMSGVATATTTGVMVSFYSAGQITQAGQINWASNPPGDGQIYFKIVGSSLDYQIAENPTGNSVTLANNEVAYINLTRNVQVAPNLLFTTHAGSPGTTTVVSVGSVPWTTGLSPGDWIRAYSDTTANYYQIQTVNNSFTVTLTGQYVVANQSAAGVPGVYAYGTYTLPLSTGTPRDIVLADRSLVPINQNVIWLFFRSDDGGSTPRVYVQFLGAELQQGDIQELSGPQLDNVLQYIGSPSESDTAPDYTATVYPGALQEILSITTGAASTMTTSNQYAYLFSSGSNRQYYIWVNYNGTGVDPTPLANAIGLPWDIVPGQTSTQTASSLVTLINSTYFNDFTASSVGNVVTVVNNSAGLTTAPSNINISAPFAMSVIQAGTGQGNYSIQDGQNLTLAIKEIDDVIASLISASIQPGYDETVTIVASGATPPTSLTGPIASLTLITLPNNSRLSGDPAVHYVVGYGKLEMFLNGQKMTVGDDYTEVGSVGAPATQIELQRPLVVGDRLEFTFAGGGGGGGGGQQGPPGPQGPAGMTGQDALGGPVSISTKTGATYSVLSTDCFLRADCTSNSVTFNLPAASSVTGQVFYMKKVDSTTNAMNIVANGTDLIDGNASYAVTTQYVSYSLISNGTGWDIF
jgi:hypothetical protein